MSFFSANVYGEYGGDGEKFPYIKKTGDTATGLIVFNGGIQTNVGEAVFNGPIVANGQVTFNDTADFYVDCPSEFAEDVTITGGTFTSDVPATFNDSVTYNSTITFNDTITVDGDLIINGPTTINSTPEFTAGANFGDVGVGSMTTINQNEVYVTDLVGLNVPYASINNSGLIQSFTSTDARPQLILTNKNGNGGASSVQMQTYKDKNGTGGEVGDDIFLLSMTGQTADSTQVDYCSITSSILDPDDVSFQGVLTLSAAKGGTLQNFLSMDGTSNTVTLFKNLKFADSTVQSTAFTGSIVPVVTTSPIGYYPAWTFVNNTEWNFQITSSLAIGYYTVTWQGQLQNLANAIFPGLTTGLRVGAVGSISPTKFPNIQLLKLTNTGTSDNFIYFGGSVSFYNSIAQQISVYVGVSNGYVPGTTPSVASLFSTTTIKLS